MMKKIFLSFLLLPVLGYAQDTCKLKRTTDTYTKEKKMSTGFVSFESGGEPLYISFDATSTEVDIFFWFRNDTRCFDNESSMQVNYEGERLKATYKNTGSMNCQGAFHVSFKNVATTPSNLRRFTDKRIASFKITGSDKKITEINLSEEQRQQLQRMANCLVNESKELLKK